MQLTLSRTALFTTLAIFVVALIPQLSAPVAEMIRQASTVLSASAAKSSVSSRVFNLNPSLNPVLSSFSNRLAFSDLLPRSYLTQRSSFTTSSAMSNSNALFDAVRNRRTYYALTNESTIPDSRILELVNETVKHVPSSFNSQSARLVVVLGKEHQKLWDMITDVYREMLPAEKFEQSKPRFDGFRAGYGTILFHEDQETVRYWQDKFPTYADKFPQFSEHSSGMHQYVLWTALEAEGMGANLQHYNPPIDSKLSEAYGTPKDWELKSQLVFGKATGGPSVAEKTFKPLEERIKVVGAS